MKSIKQVILLLPVGAEHFLNNEKSFSLRRIEGYTMKDLQEFRAIVWRGEDMVLKEYILKEY